MSNWQIKDHSPVVSFCLSDPPFLHTQWAQGRILPDLLQPLLLLQEVELLESLPGARCNCLYKACNQFSPVFLKTLLLLAWRSRQLRTTDLIPRVLPHRRPQVLASTRSFCSALVIRLQEFTRLPCQSLPRLQPHCFLHHQEQFLKPSKACSQTCQDPRPLEGPFGVPLQSSGIPYSETWS